MKWKIFCAAMESTEKRVRQSEDNDEEKPPPPPPETQSFAVPALTMKIEPAIARGSVRVQRYMPYETRVQIGGEKLSVPSGPGRTYYPNTRDVVIHSSNVGFGGSLSPFHLRDESGRIMENVWQFAKLYPSVEAQRQPMSRRWQLQTIIWEHGAETHTGGAPDHVPNDAYWAWRAKGMANKYAVRYPVGYHARHTCLCHVTDQGDKLDYIEARKRIYCEFYVRHGQHKQDFLEMKRMLGSGTDVQILDVDGPDFSLDYAPYDSISANDRGMIMSEECVRMLLHDTRKPFGHGFVIAALLMDGHAWLK